MMNYWYIIVLLFVAGAHTQQVCSNVGQTCNDTATTSYDCAYNSKCSRDTKICVAEAPLGGDCSTLTCADGRACMFNSSYQYECSSAFALPGQACSANSDCMFYSSNQGWNSTCISGKCYGLKQGAVCTNTYNTPYIGQCDMGLICNNSYQSGFGFSGYCVPALSTGQTCVAAKQCTPGLSCVPVNASSSQCMRLYSGTSGSYCTNPTHCADLYFCASNNTCVKPPSGKNPSCSSDADCNGGVCSSGTCYYPGLNVQGYAAANLAMTDCQYANPPCQVNQTCEQCWDKTCAVARFEDAGIEGTTWWQCGLSPALVQLFLACPASGSTITTGSLTSGAAGNFSSLFYNIVFILSASVLSFVM